MKPWSKARLHVSQSTPVLVAAVFLAMVAIAQTGCTGCRIASSPTPSPQPAKALRSAGTLPGAAGMRLLCPTFGPSAATPPPQTQGSRKVILSWKASVADARHDAALAYCIYRGVRHKDRSPELINSMAVPGTRCTDDRVENDKKYYYVVRAISAKGVISTISNEAPAAIPAGNPVNPSASGASAPLCRDPASWK